MEINLLLEHLGKFSLDYYITIVDLFVLAGTVVGLTCVGIFAVIIEIIKKGYTKNMRHNFLAIFYSGVIGGLIFGLVAAPKPFDDLTRTEYDKLVSNEDLFSKHSCCENYIKAGSYFDLPDYYGGLTDSGFKIYPVNKKNGIEYLAVPEDYATDLEKAMYSDTLVQYTVSELNPKELSSIIVRLSKSQMWHIKKSLHLSYGIVTKIGDTDTNVEELLGNIEVLRHIKMPTTSDLSTAIMFLGIIASGVYLCSTLISVMAYHKLSTQYTSYLTSLGTDNDKLMKELASHELDLLLAEVRQAKNDKLMKELASHELDLLLAEVRQAKKEGKL